MSCGSPRRPISLKINVAASARPSRPGDDAADVGGAIGALYGAGLVHVSGDLIEPTRPARYLDDLLGNPSERWRRRSRPTASRWARRCARREVSREIARKRSDRTGPFHGAIERGGFSPVRRWTKWQRWPPASVCLSATSLRGLTCSSRSGRADTRRCTATLIFYPRVLPTAHGGNYTFPPKRAKPPR